MGILKTAQENPFWTTFAAGAVTLTSIIGGFQALGIDPIPWATAADIDEVRKEGETRDEKILGLIKELQTEQRVMRRDQISLMREFWEKRRDEAAEELAANPASRSARKQKAEAEQQLQHLDQMTEGSPHP